MSTYKKEFKFEKILGDAHIDYLNVYKYVSDANTDILLKIEHVVNNKILFKKRFKYAEYKKFMEQFDYSNGYKTKKIMDALRLTSNYAKTNEEIER